MQASKFGLACLVGAFMAMPAAAQLSGQGGTIQVEAQESQVLERKKQVIISGNVNIEQADTALRADKVVLSYAGVGGNRTSGIGGGFGDIKSMRATGDVWYVTPEMKASGDSGFYDAANEIIKLDGQEVLLWRGTPETGTDDGDIARGKCLIMNLREGRTDLYGSRCDETGNGRVVFVIDQATAGQASQ